MKILHIGNTANIGYLVTSHMRNTGINMELIMEKNPPPPNDPLLRDPNLKNVYPNWIDFYDKEQFISKIKIFQKIKKYDLIHANSGLIIYPYLARKPYIVQVLGSELRILAFSKSLKGMLMRFSLKKAKAIIVSSPEMISLVKKLKLKNFIFLPFFLDFTYFNPQIIDKGKYEKNLVIFSPTNLNWKHKGNDRLVHAFAKFLKKNPNARLLLVEHGIDSQKTRKLVKSLNIKEYVNMLKGPLSKSDLEYYYNISDIVADQFIVDDIGAIGREALCCKKPLVCNFNQNEYSKLFVDLPSIAKASTSEEIFHQLVSLENEDYRNKVGKEGLDWITKNNSIEKFQKNLTILYNLVQSGENITQIKKKLKYQS